MDTTRAEILTRELLVEHGLAHLRFEWHASHRAVGACHFVRRNIFTAWMAVKISLSLGLVQHNDESIIRNTILHEIAHAKAGKNAGHGPIWKLAAVSVGAKPEATCSVGVQRVPTDIKAVCPACSHVYYFVRMPRKTKYCICNRTKMRQNWVGLNPERV